MKQAYLVMAHNNPEQLKILLNLLDYSENEIYLHIDKKNDDIDIDLIKNIIKNASIHVYKKYKVYHADISQTKCQIFLLDEACRTYHDFYHLISNADMPLKPHKEIIKFFEQNTQKQFIHFESSEYSNKESCMYYHFLFSLIKKVKHKTPKRILQILEDFSIRIQKILKVHRNFYTGANWFSITHELAVDFCSHKNEILNKAKWTISSDELVLQTFIRNISKIKYQLFAQTKDGYDYNSIKRKIDWHRGAPYVFKSSDYDELINSDALFARKFDIKTDGKIIRDIMNYVIAE